MSAAHASPEARVAREGRKRIALFTNTMRSGGLQRGVLNLADGFLRRGHAVDLLLARATGAMLESLPDGLVVRELRDDWPAAIEAIRAISGTGSLALSWHATRRPRALSSLRALTRYLAQERPDALIATPSISALVALFAAQLANSRTPIFPREANALSAQLAHRRPFYSRSVIPLVREWYPRAAGIVAVSQDVADTLAADTGQDRSRITVIHNPVDVGSIRSYANARPPEAIVARPLGTPLILSAGRLVGAKDFPSLLRAFEIVRRLRPAKLVILGRGPRLLELMARARLLGIARDVRFPGWVSNPFAFMAHADLFVLPSLYEGMPNVVREALLCGCRVVATDGPGGTREALGFGRYGRLAPPGDPVALAREICASLDERDSPTGALARAESVVTYDSVERYLALLFPSSGAAAHGSGIDHVD